jgi:hypothetical protein
VTWTGGSPVGGYWLTAVESDVALEYDNCEAKAVEPPNTDSVSLTTVTASDTVFGFFASAGQASLPTVTGYTGYTAQITNFFYTYGYYDLDVGAAGNKTITTSNTNASYWLWRVAGFKAASTGPVGSSTATLAGVSGSAAGYLAQIAAPTSDAAVGSWQTTGANLFSVLDEYPANDADYIFTFTKLSPCRIKLGTLTDPVSSTGHKMYYRIKGDGSATMTVKLYTGGSSTVGTGTLVKTWTHAPAPSGLTDYEQTLSGGEADAITDYANLYLEFEAS